MEMDEFGIEMSRKFVKYIGKSNETLMADGLFFQIILNCQHYLIYDKN